MNTLSRTGLLGWCLLSACHPTADSFISEGGRAPEPRATFQGTLTYIGPPPTCDDQGIAKGVALLTLFSERALPPPEGAGLPVSLQLLHGDDLFRPDVDCRTSSADTRIISRSAPFSWPGIRLDDPLGGAANYRILALWDDDRDFNPLYLVRSSATRGDVVGGAFEGPLDALVPTKLRVGPSADYQNGQVVKGISVTVAIPVSTEVPLFKLRQGTKPLSSEATWPLAFDRPTIEAGVYALTEAGLVLPDVEAAPYARALEVAGLPLDTDPVARAWYLHTMDLNGDGEPDPHPIFGPVAGIQRLFPVVALQRARTPAEVQAGVPNVVVLPNPRPERSVQALEVDLLVPPMAIVQLKPLDARCNIPYAAPGNVTLVYESAGATCSELPTGVYDISVVHGFAGGVPEAATSSRSETGFDLVGGRPSGQFWTIPNELGPPDLRYSPDALNQLDPPDVTADSPQSITIAEQGHDGRFVISDPNPDPDLPSKRPECGEAFDPILMTVRPIAFTPVPTQCCLPVKHLCGLPLCPTRELPNGAGKVREMESLSNEGKPTCTPFEMPPSCCR